MRPPKTFLFKSICFIGLLFACVTALGSNVNKNNRIPLTSERYRLLMKANEQEALAQLTHKINTLENSITTNNLESDLLYQQFIDEKTDLFRAYRMLAGLKNMQHTLGYNKIHYAKKCNPKLDRLYPAPLGYGWVDNMSGVANILPHIYFCRGFEDNIENKIAWHFHELSHLPAPYGMDTRDYSYSLKDCHKWATESPEKTIKNATCITLYLRK